jgi:hypothetical protein
MGTVVPFVPASPPSRQEARMALAGDWSAAWVDVSLDPLQAYETGMLIGQRCAILVAENHLASQWLLAELLELIPTNRRQHSIRSGLVDAVTRALARTEPTP